MTWTAQPNLRQSEQAPARAEAPSEQAPSEEPSEQLPAKASSGLRSGLPLAALANTTWTALSNLWLGPGPAEAEAPLEQAPVEEPSE